MSTSELSALDLLNLFGVFLQAMNYQSDLSQASNADIAKQRAESLCLYLQETLKNRVRVV